jgi:hypothetical protein
MKPFKRLESIAEGTSNQFESTNFLQGNRRADKKLLCAGRAIQLRSEAELAEFPHRRAIHQGIPARRASSCKLSRCAANGLFVLNA